MVSEPSGSGAPDRGQLVLIGAITIAFILLGVVVVYNGVQYTETVNTGEADRSVEHVQTVEAELEAGVAALIKSEDDEDDFVDSFEEFKSRYRNTTANRQPAVIKMDIDSTADWADDTVTIEYQYVDGATSVSKTMTVNASAGGP